MVSITEFAGVNIEKLAREEIYRWYDIFYCWSRGLISSYNESYIEPIYEALASDFHVVLTDGRYFDKNAYWSRLCKLYSSRAGNPKSEITNLVIKPVSEDSVLAVFDLFKEGSTNKKVDTALLRLDPKAPAGISWVHVHESSHDLDTGTKNMITVENNVGRLIELRQTKHIDMQQLQDSFPFFQKILESRADKFVMGTDWRGMNLLSSDVSNVLVEIMRSENARIERQAVIIDPKSIVGLQIKRMFEQGGGQSRMVFESPVEASRWLSELLTPEESQQLKRFLRVP